MNSEWFCNGGMLLLRLKTNNVMLNYVQYVDNVRYDRISINKLLLFNFDLINPLDKYVVYTQKFAPLREERKEMLIALIITIEYKNRGSSVLQCLLLFNCLI